MSDRIEVTRLAVFAHHGALDEEARLGQRFYVSLSLEIDLRAAGAADQVSLSVHYGEAAARAHAVATGRRFRTIEGLAEAVAADLLGAFPRLLGVRVTVEKPSAPVPLVLETVAVTIERRRSDAAGGALPTGGASPAGG